MFGIITYYRKEDRQLNVSQASPPSQIYSGTLFHHLG